MRFGKIVTALTVSGLVLAGTAAVAQSSSYTPGTVWNFSSIQIEPGQFENYMDFLAKTWKKSNEFGAKEGTVLSYHVLQVHNPRHGDPDLILAIESKDYMTTADQLAMQKRWEAFMATDGSGSWPGPAGPEPRLLAVTVGMVARVGDDAEVVVRDAEPFEFVHRVGRVGIAIKQAGDGLGHDVSPEGVA